MFLPYGNTWQKFFLSLQPKEYIIYLQIDILIDVWFQFFFYLSKYLNA